MMTKITKKDLKIVEKCKSLCENIKEILGDEIEKVVVSNRINDSPCCLVTNEYGLSANMERIMKAQALSNTSQNHLMSSKKIMEINPEHPIISKLIELNNKDSTTQNLIWLMYESSLLNSGFTLQKPTSFTNRINKLIGLGLGLDDTSDNEDEDDIDNNEDDIDNNEDDNEQESTMEEVD